MSRPASSRASRKRPGGDKSNRGNLSHHGHAISVRGARCGGASQRASTMKLVFVDTVGLLALWDEDDQWHDAADAAWRGVVSSGAVPYTTPFVLLECGNAASRRPYRAAVDPIRQQFEQANTLIWPSAEEW